MKSMISLVCSNIFHFFDNYSPSILTNYVVSTRFLLLTQCKGIYIKSLGIRNGYTLCLSHWHNPRNMSWYIPRNTYWCKRKEQLE